jgi:anaerobic magnesium-protoporphyrin IX monomethyl ester cyclase
MRPLRILVVDLNNFARYPTVAVGYLSSILRRGGEQVTVFSPLAYGVPGVPREMRETRIRGLARRFNYALAGTNNPLSVWAKSTVAYVRDLWSSSWSRRRILRAFDGIDIKSFDLVLVSTYLMYFDVCVEIGRRCQQSNVPLLIGGSYFSIAAVAREWLSLPGLTALVAGEVEMELVGLVRAATCGSEISKYSGVWLPNGKGGTREPLRELDQVPFPDYRDFPWSAYPNKIIPIITGRGCGWGVCAFCSDVTSTAGRTFRSRSSANILAEIEYHARTHSASLFAFTDLKLNSDIDVWLAILGNMRTIVPEANWICAVHVGSEKPNGLDSATLRQASAAGLVRITTGLESGSQRMLDAMKKGTDLETNSRFLIEASAVGISVRVTMIHGYPGEDARDVYETAEYLERYSAVIDRVMLNRFQIILGPTFMRQYEHDSSRYPDIRAVKRSPKMATATHQYARRSIEYVRATQQLLSVVHQINRKPLHKYAAQFEGVM